MSDTARARASRRNGRKSKGPRTLAGKRRAAGHARKHGLTLPALHDPALSSQVDALARKFAGADGDPRRYELACRIAEAQVDVMRVRQTRLSLLEQVETNREALAQLVRLDRYERRALSRRKGAIWAFAEAAQAKSDFGKLNLDGKTQ